MEKPGVWDRWFAWRPVVDYWGHLRWLCWLERRRHPGLGPGRWQYRTPQ